ncbi:hypothetical protein J5N97_028937 [Dioscorea zingiberensis]|uniref:Protein kinase domain-containing protein n=1 Tax=Dioscorea zingiberensis TaxID=325984 RepID=A0A9D5BZR5_9LILI|nr:hypothetical protein J5N97_028937 [Dioscorea zingiberensis]
MADEEPKNMSMFPLDAKSYHIMHEIGSGVSGVVYKAVCIPMNSAVVAIKAIDLERSRANLDDVRKEAKVMVLLSHPNILRAHCSFTVDSQLWVVMPFMAAGSLHSIISSSFPDGLPEPAIAIVLKEILSALAYLHDQGHIHRDIKAGNILVDSDGSVKLADFGVSASIYESHPSFQWCPSSSSSFCNDMAGTPYWMAPEVIHSHVGYGIKADIWSFGITALELAHGRPPLSHLPLSKSLMMRITNRFRIEDSHYKNDKEKKKKKFSKAFKEMVASCLSQDPSKRPSAEKLLRHPFFKNCRSVEYLVKNMLQAVPSMEERFKDMSINSDSNSPIVKVRRVSGWNFNEDVLEMDPVFPTENDEKCTINCVQHHGEEMEDKACCPDSIVVEVNRINAKEGEESPKDVCASPPNSTAVPKQLLIPNLVSLLSSLDVQRVMVKNVLACCGGMAVDEEKLRDQREQQLLGVVQRLQRTVDELNIQLQQELRRNAHLEAALDCIKKKGSAEEGNESELNCA